MRSLRVFITRAVCERAVYSVMPREMGVVFMLVHTATALNAAVNRSALSLGLYNGL